MEAKVYFQFEIILNTYVMGLRSLETFSLLQWRGRYRRQILTTKVDPSAVRGNEWCRGYSDCSVKGHTQVNTPSCFLLMQLVREKRVVNAWQMRGLEMFACGI